jgi:hypothetical protein
MILILREFRARSGDEERLLAALRQRAAAMVREGRVDAVVVCQRTDAPTGVLWIQHHVGAAVGTVDGNQALPSAESGLVACGGIPVRLEFVDGMYQFPLPGCELWGLETCDEERIRALLSVSRLAASDRRIAGITIYRTAEDPSRMLAFLALTSGVSPGAYLELGSERDDRTMTVYPLRVSSTIGRLTPGTRAGSAFSRYPRAAFWARLGPSPPDAASVKPPLGMETSEMTWSLSMPSTTLIVVVITCGRCGQTWQRSALVEGQTVECIFCGHHGRLSTGPTPGSTDGDARRVEAWLP